MTDPKNVPAKPGLFTGTALATGSGSSFSQKLATNRAEQAAQGLTTGRTGPGGAAGYPQLDRTGLGWFDGTGAGRRQLSPQTVWAIPTGAIQRLVIGWNPATNTPYHKSVQPLEAPLVDISQIAVPPGCRAIESGYQVPMMPVWGPDRLPEGAPSNVFIWESSTGGTKDAIELLGRAYEERDEELVEAGADVALVRLDQTSYANKTHGGTTYKPILDVLGWCKAEQDDLLDALEDLGLGPENGAAKPAGPAPVRNRKEDAAKGQQPPPRGTGQSNRRPRAMRS